MSQLSRNFTQFIGKELKTLRLAAEYENPAAAM
jgi:hypothetical protein